MTRRERKYHLIHWLYRINRRARRENPLYFKIHDSLIDWNIAGTRCFIEDGVVKVKALSYEEICDLQYPINENEYTITHI